MSLLKRAHFEKLLESEWSVFVYLDPRAPEVVVPSGHKKNAVLLLEIGLNMPVHIPLDVDNDGFVATLSFNRQLFKCEVPWTSVFALVGKSDKRGCVFEADVPTEVRAVQLRGFGKEDGLVVSEKTAVAASGETGAGTAAEKKKTLPPGWGGIIRGGKSN